MVLVDKEGALRAPRADAALGLCLGRPGRRAPTGDPVPAADYCGARWSRNAHTRALVLYSCWVGWLNPVIVAVCVHPVLLHAISARRDMTSGGIWASGALRMILELRKVSSRA